LAFNAYLHSVLISYFAINSKVLTMPEMEQDDFLRSSAGEFPLKNGERHVSTSVGVGIVGTC